MVVKSYIRIVFVACFAVFAINKLWFRPWAIENLDSGFLIGLTYSLPNFIEAVMGVLLISGILTYLRQTYPVPFARLKDVTLYGIAGLIAAIYVLSQEVGIHNLGGNNVYDPNDVMASLLGLTATVAMLCRFGLVSRHGADEQTR